jgi:hypothetical protein
MEKAVYVTDDHRMKDGRLDPDDERSMKEAARHGEVVIMDLREALEAMRKSEPEKFEKFHKNQEVKAGRVLTPDELVEFARKAGERYDEFQILVKGMTRQQALMVRKFRVEERCTWRAVARNCFILGWGDWQPASNQIMGIALCQRAADILGENYRMEPWN